MQAPAIFGDFEITPRKIAIGIGIILGFVGLALLYRQIDVQALHRRAEGMNGFVIFGLMTVLPLVGFPVSVTHAVAGMRFGIPLGLAMAAGSIVLQMLASYALVKVAPQLFARRLESFRKRLPQGAH